MIFHVIAPGWEPTGDTACSVMGDRGVIATVYQPAPRNGPGWTPEQEQQFQRFITTTRRQAENWNMLPPGGSYVHWFHSAPPSAIVEAGRTPRQKGPRHAPEAISRLIHAVVHGLYRRPQRTGPPSG